MHKLASLPALLALSVGLVACASKPNPNLEQARAAFTALQGNPRAGQLAPLETQDAAKQLKQAEDSYQSGASKEKVDQLAYLTQRRVEFAEQTILLRNAEREFQQTSSQRAEARLQARDAQIRQLQEELQASHTERGTLVTFGDVLFDYNRAELKPGGMHNVQKLADFLRASPQRQVIVEGYTDSSGSDAYNRDLSERRAGAVRIALIKMGIDPRRIATQGYGKDYPVASNASPTGRAMNRRVEVTISDEDDRPVAPRTSMQ
ncbi:OmpA family protein [Azorhizophilus paspali]|uniref:OmpA family protein n=1 Tax=Azorhizophilus paspali TaxID=69963 RepID=A0ABV6SJ76_AZOPA